MRAAGSGAGTLWRPSRRSATDGRGSLEEMLGHDGADRVNHGEASLGEAQSSNPPDDPEMIEDDAAPLDADTDYEGEGTPAEEERDNEDPAPSAP
jgi:hypothetical protein